MAALSRESIVRIFHTGWSLSIDQMARRTACVAASGSPLVLATRVANMKGACAYGRYICGSCGSVSESYFVSGTTPTTVAIGFCSKRTARPIALMRGQKRDAKERLTIATPAEVALSASVNERPSSIGILTVSKYVGVIVFPRARNGAPG